MAGLRFSPSPRAQNLGVPVPAADRLSKAGAWQPDPPAFPLAHRIRLPLLARFTDALDEFLHAAPSGIIGVGDLDVLAGAGIAVEAVTSVLVLRVAVPVQDAKPV